VGEWKFAHNASIKACFFEKSRGLARGYLLLDARNLCLELSNRSLTEDNLPYWAKVDVLIEDLELIEVFTTGKTIRLLAGAAV